MAKKLMAPVHPGEILKTEFLDELDVSAYALAKALRVPTNRISGIVNGDRAITADTALRLARFFSNTPEFWLNLQTHYDLTVASRSELAKIEREVPQHVADIVGIMRTNNNRAVTPTAEAARKVAKR